MTKSENKQNWKDNPMIVGVASSITTLTIVISIFFTVIIPTWIKDKDNEIIQLREIKNKYDKLLISDSLKTKKIETYENDCIAKLFNPLDPYPCGLDEVRIGDNIKKIIEVYNPPKTHFEKTFIMIEIPDYKGPFYKLKFTYGVVGNDTIINAITYWFTKNKVTFSYIEKRAKAAFEFDNYSAQDELVSKTLNDLVYKTKGFYFILSESAVVLSKLN